MNTHYGKPGEMRRLQYWRTLRKVLREKNREGELSDEDFQNAMRQTSNPRVMDRVIKKSQEGSEHFYGEFSWSNIWDWIKENWFEILKIIITIVIFLGEEDEEQSEMA